MSSSDTLLTQLENYNTIDLVNRSIAIVIIVAGALCLGYVFMGGISFITAGGQDDKVKQALGTIRHAILGLLLTVASVFIVGTIGRSILGLDVIKYISYKEIFAIVKSITNPESSNDVNSLD